MFRWTDLEGIFHSGAVKQQLQPDWLDGLQMWPQCDTLWAGQSHGRVRNSHMEVCISYRCGVSGYIHCIFGLNPTAEPKLVAHVSWQCCGTGLEWAGPGAEGLTGGTEGHSGMFSLECCLPLWSSPVGNEFNWRHSEEVHGKHPVLHNPWSCTACGDAVGSSSFWLWEFGPKFQHGHHGKQKRSPPLAMPLLQDRSSFAFAILTYSPLVLQNLFSCRSCGILCTASLQFQPQGFPCCLDFPCCSLCFSSDVPSPIWSSVTPPALGPEVSSLGSLTCCSPFYKGTAWNSACNSVSPLFCSLIISALL